MLRKIDHKLMGNNDLGWLKTLYHFSFANYYNPANMNFGVLRVLNDDMIEAQTGFDTHPHNDMEIITYVIDGELTHQDSMGNSQAITRGHVQYMSAGTGVYHSEHNMANEPLRLIQLWIHPDRKGHKPNYGDFRFKFDERKNNWLHMVSPKSGDAPIKINQDANIYSLSLEQGKDIDFKVENGRQAYMVLLEGVCNGNETLLDARDALEIVEESVTIQAKEDTHILLIEMSI
ncbi:pirin family protein [Haloplasma contractile]|uniref:O-succinylbenzoic acid--CoA ligase protein n=1 Tax=Haloplasma contractile SSD-17B TaxID=1033810 RepID=F7PRG3_9MOLU|nr:pirin family protein [Haloplasma contractile]ERJ11710.1 O-succinylbenzoic acid--CoA ligase protein [Haloplasma contractile SSD-17B]